MISKKKKKNARNTKWYRVVLFKNIIDATSLKFAEKQPLFSFKIQKGSRRKKTGKKRQNTITNTLKIDTRPNTHTLYQMSVCVCLNYRPSHNIRPPGLLF